MHDQSESVFEKLPQRRPYQLLIDGPQHLPIDRVTAGPVDRQ
jgi:hypothetical protein